MTTSAINTALVSANGETTFTVTSRDQSVTVDLASLSDEITMRLALYGLGQKVADAGASALAAAHADTLPEGHGLKGEALKEARKAFGDDPSNADAIAAKGVELMQKAVAGLVAGEWSVRAEGNAVTDAEKALAAEFDAWVAQDTANKDAKAAMRTIKRDLKGASTADRIRAKAALAKAHAVAIAEFEIAKAKAKAVAMGLME